MSTEQVWVLWSSRRAKEKEEKEDRGRCAIRFVSICTTFKIRHGGMEAHISP
jgi:hypothetical protein